jgi:hypothetical protein
VLILPILVALAAGEIGVMLGGGGNGALKALGTLIGLLLFIAVAGSAAIGVRAAMRPRENFSATEQPKEGAA